MHETAAAILKSHGVDPSFVTYGRHNPHVLLGTAPTDRALAIWKALRESYGQTKLWPIIQDGRSDIDQTLDPATTLENVPDGSIWEILDERLTERIAFYREFVEGIEEKCDALTLAARVDASDANRFSSESSAKEPWPT